MTISWIYLLLIFERVQGFRVCGQILEYRWLLLPVKGHADLCFWSSVVRCMNIYDYYVFMLNWPFYHYVMSFFIPDNIPWAEVYFVWNWYSFSSFLLVSICMYIFFHSFTFHLCFYIKSGVLEDSIELGLLKKFNLTVPVI